MAEYAASPQENTLEAYLVHLQHCPSLAELKNVKNLGSYSSKQAAYNKAAGLYDPVDYCPKCFTR